MSLLNYWLSVGISYNLSFKYHLILIQIYVTQELQVCFLYGGQLGNLKLLQYIM